MRQNSITERNFLSLIFHDKFHLILYFFIIFSESLRKHLQETWFFFCVFNLTFPFFYQIVNFFFEFIDKELKKLVIKLLQIKRRIARIFLNFQEEILSLRGCSGMLVLCCKESLVRKVGQKSFWLWFTFVGCVGLWRESCLGHVLLTNFANFQLKTLLVRENDTMCNLKEE